MADLSEKQRRFAEHYVTLGSVTDAAVAAGYSERSAHNQGYRLMKNDAVVALIRDLQAKSAKAFDISRERLAQEYARIAFGDIRKAVRWKSNVLAAYVDPDDDSGEAAPAGVHVNDVQFLDSDEIDDDTALAISEVGKDSRGGLKMKMHDKMRALDSLARMQGFFDGHAGNPDPGDDQASDLIDDRAAARRVAHLLLRAANAPAALSE